MAKKERQKRSARKARAAERAEREANYVQQAVARGEDAEKAKEEFAKANVSGASAPKTEKVEKKPNIFQRIGGWFSGVFKEMRLVVWPTPRELRNYSFAVIGLLITFGLIVWGVDTGITAGLVQVARLRPDAPAPTVVDTTPVEVPATTDAAATPAEADVADTAATSAEAAPADAAAATDAAAAATPATQQAPTEGATANGTEG